MTDRPMPVPAKWPFFLGDVVLLALAAWIVSGQPHPLPPVPLTLVVACVAGGAWLAVMPFRAEFEAAVKFAESEQLHSTVVRLDQLEELTEQVKRATSQWQGVQEHSAKAVASAKEIGERMATEAKSFAEFMQQANEVEKSHLRLEVDKLRRGEGEWLQILVRLMDHIFALQQAGAKSGQPNLAAQLNGFQAACRDIVRRIGLVATEARPGDPFDGKGHQWAEAKGEPPADARVTEVVATGYTFQGQVLRLPVVRIEPPPNAVTSPADLADPPEKAPVDPQLELETGS